MIYGNYTAFVYLTPFFGGIIADRWLGQRYSVIVGGVLMAAAEFTLMVPQYLFIGLFLLILGNGFFKPNISTQVGNLYRAGDSRIDRAYSIFMSASMWVPSSHRSSAARLAKMSDINGGSLPRGLGMAVGQVVYVFALRTLPPDRISRMKTSKEEKKPLTAREWKSGHSAHSSLHPHQPVLGRLRATGQHHQSLGAGLHEPTFHPRSPRLADSRNLVPGI